MAGRGAEAAAAADAPPATAGSPATALPAASAASAASEAPAEAGASGAGGAGEAGVAGGDSIDISMTLGERGFTYGGQRYDSLPPLSIGGAAHLPLRAVAEAFGAWLIFRPAPAAGSVAAAVEGAFMDRSFRLVFGADSYTLDGEPVDAPGGAMRLVDGSAYVPLAVFDGCMGTSAAVDPGDGSISIRLSDDGSIKDLSSLLGEIRESRIGNSYFGWMMDVPKKSMLVSSSFSGNEVQIYSDIAEALIEVSVIASDGRRLDYFLENQDEISSDFEVHDASIKGSGSERHVEAILTDYYSVGLKRIYISDGRQYSATILLFPQETPTYGEPDFSVFTGDDASSTLLDTFRLRYQPDGASTLDVSKVVGDKLRYDSFIDIPESDRMIKSWSISILPDWYEMYSTTADDIFTLLGGDDSENVAVTIYRPNDIAETDSYFRKYRSIEADNYNEELYRLVRGSNIEYRGYRAIDMTFMLSDGEAIHAFMERMIRVGRLVYDITLRTTEERYESDGDKLREILDSFEIGADGRDEIEANLTKQASAARASRLSKTDDAVSVGDGRGGWTSSLPGYWTKDGVFWATYPFASAGAFENAKNDARVAVYETQGELEEYYKSYFDMLERLGAAAPAAAQGERQGGQRLGSGFGAGLDGDGYAVANEELLKAIYSEYELSSSSDMEEVAVGGNRFMRIACDLRRDDTIFPFYGELYVFLGSGADNAAGGGSAGAAGLAGAAGVDEGAGTAESPSGAAAGASGGSGGASQSPSGSGAAGSGGAAGSTGASDFALGGARYMISVLIPQIYMSESNMGELESFLKNFAADGAPAQSGAAGRPAGSEAVAVG
jgi:hypothetical protein